MAKLRLQENSPKTCNPRLVLYRGVFRSGEQAMLLVGVAYPAICGRTLIGSFEGICDVHPSGALASI